MIENDARRVKGKIVTNTIYNVVGRFWSLGLAFIVTPYVVSHLGTDRFGMWSLLVVMTSYMGLFDLGFSSAYVKYVAEFLARDEYEELNGLISTGFVAFLIVFPVLACAVMLLAPSILNWFAVPDSIYVESLLAFRLAVAVFALSQILGIFQAMLNGLQRMDLANKIQIGGSVLSAFIILIGVSQGYGLLALVVATFASSFLTALLSWRAVRKLIPQFRLAWNRVARRYLRDLWGYGLRIQITNAAYLGVTQVDRLLVGRFVGLSGVAQYSLGSMVTNTIRSFVNLPLTSLLPATSELATYADTSLLAKLLTRGSKYLAALTIPAAVFLFAEAPLIMRAWLGEGFEQAGLVLRILLVGHTVSIVLTGVGTSMTRGMGQPGLETRATTAILILIIGLGIPLTIRLGLVGASASVAIALFVPALYFLKMFSGRVGVSLRRFGSEVLVRPVLFAAAGGLTLLVSSALFLGSTFVSNRITALVQLALQAVLFALTYGVLVFKSDLIEAGDRIALRTFVAQVVRRMSRARSRSSEAH